MANKPKPGIPDYGIKKLGKPVRPGNPINKPTPVKPGTGNMPKRPKPGSGMMKPLPVKPAIGSKPKPMPAKPKRMSQQRKGTR